MSTSAAPALCLALLLVAAAAQAQDEKTLYPGFDERYGIASGADLGSLLDRPSLVSMKSRRYWDAEAGEWRLEGRGEAQGLYDLDFAQLRAVLDDPASATLYSPRVLAARIEEREGQRLVMYQKVGLGFLGLKLGYSFRAEQVRDDLGPGEVGYRIRLLESLDGSFFELYSSWYARQVLIDGRPLVYIRYYSRPGIRRPGLGMDLIIGKVTPPELRSSIDRVAAEAKRRAESARKGL